MQPTLTFYLRPPKTTQPPTGSNAPIALFLGLAALAVSVLFLWLLVATDHWQDIVPRAHSSSSRFVFPVLYTFVIVPRAVAILLRQRFARLVLDDHSLRYESGLPYVHRWLDWSLDLDAIRSRALSLREIARPEADRSTRWYLLGWVSTKYSGDRSPQRLRPSEWHLAERSDARTKRSFFDGRSTFFVPSAAQLQDDLYALPLVQALAARDVFLPPIAAKPISAGLDLMAHARLRTAVYLFFALLVFALLLMLSVRHSYYFVSPPMGVWLASGGVVWAGMLAWLWAESGAQATPPDANVVSRPAMGFRITQTMVAALVGLAGGLCAPSLPLLYADLMATPEARLFALQKHPLQLHTTDSGRPLPLLPLDQAIEYWQSLPAGSSVILPVREGAMGLWWQYDATVVRDRWIAYYATQP